MTALTSRSVKDHTLKKPYNRMSELFNAKSPHLQSIACSAVNKVHVHLLCEFLQAFTYQEPPFATTCIMQHQDSVLSFTNTQIQSLLAQSHLPLHHQVLYLLVMVCHTEQKPSFSEAGDET